MGEISPQYSESKSLGLTQNRIIPDPGTDSPVLKREWIEDLNPFVLNRLLKDLKKDFMAAQIADEQDLPTISGKDMESIAICLNGPEALKKTFQRHRYTKRAEFSGRPNFSHIAVIDESIVERAKEMAYTSLNLTLR